MAAVAERQALHRQGADAALRAGEQFLVEGGAAWIDERIVQRLPVDQYLALFQRSAPGGRTVVTDLFFGVAVAVDLRTGPRATGLLDDEILPVTGEGNTARVGVLKRAAHVRPGMPQHLLAGLGAYDEDSLGDGV